jgi:hypothetical protein
LVTGKNTDRAKFLAENLETEGFGVFPFQVEKEPTTGMISERG